MKIVCPALIVTVSVASAQTSQVKRFQLDYDKISKAFAKNDARVIESYLAKDFVLVQPDGTTWNRAKVLDDFKKQMANMKNSRWTRTVKSAKTNGQTMQLAIEGAFDGTFKDPEGRVHTFHLTSLSLDTWTVDHKLQKSQVKKLEPMMDGQPLKGIGGH